jgi:Uma2 family endonuclease
MAAKIEPLLTVADLDACPGDNNRYELIEGELFVSRAPRLPHQLVLQNLQLILGNYLKSHPVGILVPGAGAVFSEYDAVIPDLVFVRQERWDQIVANDRFEGAPDLVVEVLSPGPENKRRDFLVKRQLYAKYGVDEYWIVDSQNRTVLVYRLQGQVLEQIEELTDGGAISSPLLPELRVNLTAIFDFEPGVVRGTQDAV